MNSKQIKKELRMRHKVVLGITSIPPEEFERIYQQFPDQWDAIHDALVDLNKELNKPPFKYVQVCAGCGWKYTGIRTHPATCNICAKEQQQIRSMLSNGN